MVKIIDEQILDELTQKAQHNPRRRLNLNFHTDLDEPVQRLLNAVEPDTYVRPHRHNEDGKWEFFLVLRGAIEVLLFTQTGALKERIRVQAGGPRYGIEIPERQWHTLIALEPQTVVFEVKQGPYAKLSDKDFAIWAPAETDPAAAYFLEWFKSAELACLPPV